MDFSICMIRHLSHHPIFKHFCCPKGTVNSLTVILHSIHLLSLPPGTPRNQYFISYLSRFACSGFFHINGIIQYSDWPLLLIIVFPRSICAAACFLAEYYSSLQNYYPFDGWVFGLFPPFGS